MKKVIAIMLILAIAFSVIGCSNQKEIIKDDNEITKDDIMNKVYVYEKDGCGGDFTIEIKADGTFTYYEGFLSSHIGIGEWSYSDGMLTLSEKTSRFNLVNQSYEIDYPMNNGMMYCVVKIMDKMCEDDKFRINQLLNDQFYIEIEEVYEYTVINIHQKF